MNQMYNMLGKMKRLGRGDFSGQLVKRWPSSPKVAFFGPPNVFLDELAMR